MITRIYKRALVKIRYRRIVAKINQVIAFVQGLGTKFLNFILKHFFNNKFNLATLVLSLFSLSLGFGFFKMGKTDTNFTYYLISVTAIYSTIQLSFLLQKISFLRAQKESHMVSAVPLWKALTNYRYLCHLMELHLSQGHRLEYERAKKLKITISELFLRDMGMLERIDKEHLTELAVGQQDKLWPDYVLLVKMVDLVVNKPGNIFSLNTLNRTFAHNNNSVNAYLGVLTNEGIFALYERAALVAGEMKTHGKTFYEQACDKPQFLTLQNMLAVDSTVEIQSVLRRMDHFIVNQVLLPLHDSTFIIEKKLPNAFLHLLINSICILICGSIIPLINAFTIQQNEVTRICGGLSVGMLLLSIVLICLTFYSENDVDLFRYSTIVYQGKNDTV